MNLYLEHFQSWALPPVICGAIGLENCCIYYAHQTHEIYQVLPYSVDFKTPGELWNPLSKTVLSKCNFIWNKGPVNILVNIASSNGLLPDSGKWVSGW